MLNDEEEAIFADLATRAGSAKLSEDVRKGITRKAIAGGVLLVGGLLATVITFSFSTPLAVVCVIIAGVGGWMCSESLPVLWGQFSETRTRLVGAFNKLREREEDAKKEWPNWGRRRGMG